MIFQLNKVRQEWSLLADTGELIGVARAVSGDCWEARMAEDFGGGMACGTHLEDVRAWMLERARTPPR